MSVPITQGTGASSIASEVIATLNYQQIKVVGGETGSTSVMGVTPDGAIKVSVIGTHAVTVSGAVLITGGSVMSMVAPKASFISGVTSVITGTGQTSVLTAGGASIKNYVTHLIVTNAAAVGTFVDIKDGGGNVMYSGYAAASGGGFVANPWPPLVGSANKSVDAQPRAQASIIVAMTGYTDS